MRARRKLDQPQFLVEVPGKGDGQGSGLPFTGEKGDLTLAPREASRAVNAASQWQLARPDPSLPGFVALANLVVPPTADPHGGRCGGKELETPGYPIRHHSGPTCD